MQVGSSLVTFVLFVVVLIAVVKAVRVVPQQRAWVVERLGRFYAVLQPGLNFVFPIVDRIAYKHDLREIPLDVPPQVCITRDNTQLQVDGILYFQVTDPRLASYGSSNYVIAITQLAQTTLRSVIGRMELDRTFEERDQINAAVVNALDAAAPNWGVKVLRYEIKDLTPPAEILRAMQAQITAEREKRALIAKSEGEKQQQINVADGARQAAILNSEGEKQAAINRVIVNVLDEAGRSWGVKVLRYEVKNLTPPETILRAMQAQITAEREKRALIAKSEGEKQQEINLAEGEKQAAILKSEGQKQSAINKAQGEATALRVVAEATAAAVEAVATAIGKEGGQQAANLKVAELYIGALGNLAKTNNTMIVPTNLSDVASVVASAMTVLDKTRAGARPA